MRVQTEVCRGPRTAGKRTQAIMSKRFETVAENLAVLLESGLPILESLHYLQERHESDRPMQALLQTAYDAIVAGDSLAEAWKDWLPPVLLATLELGNQSGHLASTLEAYTKQRRQRREWFQRLSKAAVYPVLLFVGNLLVEFFIAQVLIPEFQKMYLTTGVALTGSSRIVIAAVKVLPLILLTLCLLLVAVGLLLVGLNRSESEFWKSAVVHLPGRKLLLQVRTQKFCFSLFTLMAGGTPILEALETLRKYAAERWLRIQAASVSHNLLNGRTLAAAFSEDVDVLLPSLLHLAEQTGDVTEALAQTDRFLEREIATAVEQSLAWLEPVLLVLMGLLIAMTMYVLFVPMYNMISSIATATP